MQNKVDPDLWWVYVSHWVKQSYSFSADGGLNSRKSVGLQLSHLHIKMAVLHIKYVFKLEEIPIINHVIIRQVNVYIQLIPCMIV